MKKIIALLVTVILLTAALAGCGNERQGSLIPTVPAPSTENVPAFTTPDFDLPEVETIPTASVEVWTPPTEGGFADYFETGIEGKTEWNVYSNSYFGFQFTPPAGSDWVVLDQEMLVEYNKLNNALMSEAYADNELIQETIKEGKNVTVLAAAPLSQTAFNVNGIVSPRPASFTELSMKFIMQLMVGEMEKQVRSMGLTDATVTVEDVLFMGKLVPCMSVNAQGKHQKQVILLGEEYFCTITVTAADEANCNYCLEWFEAYP